MKPQTGKAPSAIQARGWSFWKKRLARALLLGALLILATQILPELPQDQRIIFSAPTGHRISNLQVGYFTEGDPEALGGSQVILPSPVESVPQTLRLPNGKYTFRLRVEGKDPTGKPKRWSDELQLSLHGGTKMVRLRAQESPK